MTRDGTQATEERFFRPREADALTGRRDRHKVTGRYILNTGKDTFVRAVRVRNCTTMQVLHFGREAFDALFEPYPWAKE